MSILKKITEGTKKSRICWGVIVTLCLIACIYHIVKIWKKWDKDSIIINHSESFVPIWNIPFPAVTICSETKARQTVYNFTEAFNNFKFLNESEYDEEERKKYEAMSLVCDDHLIQEGNKTTGFETIEFLSQVAPQFEEMMWFCKWKTYIVSCSKAFSPILTEDGLCYTFNMLTAEEIFRKEILQNEYQYLNHKNSSKGWTLDDGYPDSKKDTFPIRGMGSGVKTGLTVLLRALKNDLDYICRGPVQGFKVQLHTPVDIPQMGSNYFRVPLDQGVMAFIKPKMISTTESLRDYDPIRRQCFFTDERKLKFFKIYTQNNCEMECLANYTMLLCECVPFSLPRSSDMPICSAGSTKCVGEARDDLLNRKILSELKDNSVIFPKNVKPWSCTHCQKEDMDRVAARCQCLPSCTSIDYEAEVSNSDFNWKKLFQSYEMNIDEMTNLKMARLVLAYDESHFIPLKRSESYGFAEFLANCGGLFAIFLGLSLLTVFEIVYSIGLRIYQYTTAKLTKNKIRSYQ